MPRKKKYSEEVPDRVQINTDLTARQVNEYYKILNMERDTWIYGLSPAQRYELVIQDLLAKQDKIAEILAQLDEGDE